MFCIASSGVDRVAVDCSAPDAFIVITRLELSQMSPFYMDIESAGAIGGALLMVMVVAFVLRMIRKSVESSNESDT